MAKNHQSGYVQRLFFLILLWSTGWYNNQEIGNLFGLGYSSISRRVTIMKSKISEEDEMNKRLENIKSLINRLSENAKFKKSGIDFKGLMAQEFVKTPILGQPGKIRLRSFPRRNQKKLAFFFIFVLSSFLKKKQFPIILSSLQQPHGGD